MREWLAWPLAPFAATDWRPLAPAKRQPRYFPRQRPPSRCSWRGVSGASPRAGDQAKRRRCSRVESRPRPLIALDRPARAGRATSASCSVRGRAQPAPLARPHPRRGERFDLQLAIHTGMGPGGLLWRRGDGTAWSSLLAASPWGAERLTWPNRWSIGHERGGNGDRPFRGTDLRAQWLARMERL